MARVHPHTDRATIDRLKRDLLAAGFVPPPRVRLEPPPSRGEIRWAVAGAVVALAAGALLATAASAQTPSEWRYVSEDISDSVWYIREADFQAGHSQATAARMWVKVDASRDATVSYQSAVKRYTVNCVAGTYRFDQATHYYRDGTNSILRGDYQTHYATPGSIFAQVVDALCQDPEPRLSRT